jgi:hypothetical protein
MNAPICVAEAEGLPPFSPAFEFQHACDSVAKLSLPRVVDRESFFHRWI